ncbi:GTPase IMAP family member 5 [Labeo rohita]|uniref:GTPase IMAP family member 5 n=1 Tax=Labeo rohita TaxID=84645 RepID=A0ABQ8L910_LABRO|nr:GTPase IMAP family member 5 [Labeo rohita]
METLNKINEYFREGTFKHAVVLFTHGEDLEGQTIEEFTIDKMVKENGCYTNELFQEVNKLIYDKMINLHEMKQERAKKIVYEKLLIRLAVVSTRTLIGAFLGIGVAVASVVTFLKAAKIKEVINTISSAVTAANRVPNKVAAATVGGAAAVSAVAGMAEVGVAAGVIFGAAALVGASGGGITGYKAADEADSVLDAIKIAAKANYKNVYDYNNKACQASTLSADEITMIKSFFFFL